MMFERENWATMAAAIVRERICGMPEFAHARSIVVTASVKLCRGKSVPEMREIGGFSSVIEHEIRNLPKCYKIPLGSNLFPWSVADVLRQFVPAMREEVQFACAKTGQQ